MDYIWDALKDAENRRVHRLALADGIAALEDPNAESWIDDRFAYGEERTLTLGLSRARVLLVVTTELAEDLTRIISVRRAEKYEERWYYEAKP
ncbi:MAG: BrnT family toxin [Proteobacteria bacterium]|nr:BrnT family toxin [Pseudomonadota bacterium]